MSRRAIMAVNALLTVLLVGLLAVLVVLVRGAAPTRNDPIANAFAARMPQSGFPGAYPTPANYPLLALDRPLVSAVNGYTVTLHAGYANANRVVLRYTLQSAYVEFCNVGPCDTLPGQEPPCWASEPAIWPATPLPRPTSEPAETMLTTGDGRTFKKPAETYTGTGGSPIETTIVFDAPQPAEKVLAELKLHLALPYAEFRIPTEGGGAHIRSVRGPFAFDFTVPVDTARRVAKLNRTATTTRGDRITIEQVVATRQDVRVTWRAGKLAQASSSPTSLPGIERFYACCSLMLEVGGKSTTFRETSWQPEGGLAITDASVFDLQGELIVSAWYYSTYTGDMYYPPLPGAVFRFTMPPATGTP